MASQNYRSNKNPKQDDEIDLKFIIIFFNRNKKSILITSLIFFVGACIYGLLQKRVWEGQFEIVVDNQENSLQSNLLNSNLASFNLMGVSSNLETEIGILKSPSVLLPVFNYVNTERKKNNPNFEPIPFIIWKESNLKFDLKPRTSILNIKYKDSNKEIILDVLSKISSAYQEYSGRRTERNITMGINYLSQQISFYKEKASNSLKEVQEFALEEDLTFNEIDNRSQFIDQPKTQSNQLYLLSNLRNIDIERIRINSLNNIRNIDNQIDKLTDLKDDYEQLQYIGGNIPELKRETKELNKLARNLLELKTNYNNSDILIIKLNEKKEFLINLIKKRAIGYLKAQRIVEKARMESATRPKDIVVKYKELMRIAGRDESTLIKLEDQLRILTLEKEKSKDPWQLITQPTLKNESIAPRKKLIGIVGIIIGLFSGTGLALLKDLTSNKVFSKREIEKSFQSPILKTFNISDEVIKEEKEFLSIKEIINLNEGNVSFLSNNFENNKLSLIKEYFDEKLNNIDNYSSRKILFIDNDFSTINSEENCFILINMQNLTYSELEKLKQRLDYLNIDIKGIILFN